MTINPEGWGGNYFNTTSRNANQVQFLPVLQLPSKKCLGRHEIRFGFDFLYRTFTGNSASRTVNLLPESCQAAQFFNAQCAGAEQIAFLRAREIARHGLPNFRNTSRTTGR